MYTSGVWTHRSTVQTVVPAECVASSPHTYQSDSTGLMQVLTISSKRMNEARAATSPQAGAI